MSQLSKSGGKVLEFQLQIESILFSKRPPKTHLCVEQVGHITWHGAGEHRAKGTSQEEGVRKNILHNQGLGCAK